MADSSQEILDAFEHEISVPVRGDVLRDVLVALEFSTVADVVLGTAAEKLNITRADGKVHDFMFLTSAQDLSVVIRVLVHPGTERSDARVAQDDVLNAVTMVQNAEGMAGVLHLTVFAGSSPVDLRIAWWPIPQATLSAPELRAPVIPWRIRPDDQPEVEVPPDGTALIELVTATHALTMAMRELLSVWPDEDGPIGAPGIGEPREALRAAIDGFNRAAERCHLVHRMPVSVFDATWLPHNLRNALDFRSIPSSLRAELYRIWGPGGVAAFDRLLEMVRAGRQLGADDVQGIVGPAAPADTPASPIGPIDIFIGYTWADKTRGARDVYEFVRRAGFTAWIDEEQRPMTASLDAQIAAAIADARCIVICLSSEMVSAGGYALRELLFAVSIAPANCILLRLDRIPIPSVFANIRSIDWFTSNGPAQLDAELKKLPASVTPVAMPASVLAVTGALAERLVRLVTRTLPPRSLSGSGRQAQIEIRAHLCEAVLAALEQDAQRQWHGVLTTIDTLKSRGEWLSVTDPLLQAEPTVAGVFVRLRLAGFRANVQLANEGNWAQHNSAAYAMLEELVTIDPSLLDSAPALGWRAADSRVAVRDCLDAFEFADEWFRGWSPKLLIEMCGVPGTVNTIQQRIAIREALLIERMLGLRLIDDAQSARVTSWSSIFEAFRSTMITKLQAGGHPQSAAYFKALYTWVDDAVAARAAVALADGANEILMGTGSYREELIGSNAPMRIRLVVRAYRSLPSKLASLKLAHGTVAKDLTERPGGFDLSLLVSAFVLPEGDPDELKYELNLNVLPHPGPAAEQLTPRIQGPLIMPQMLEPEEFEALMRDLPGERFYEEV